MAERNKYADLLTRLKTAFVLGIMIIGSLFVHPLAFLTVIGTFFFFVSIEFIAIRDRYFNIPRISLMTEIYWSLWCLLPFLISLYYYYLDSYPVYMPGLFLVVSLIFSFISLTDLFRCSFTRILRLPKWVITLGYFGSHMALLPILLFNLPEQWSLWILAILFTIWANDTFSFFTGKMMGNKKLYPSVSPNKTIEGFFGGIVGSILMAYFFTFFLDINYINGIIGGFVIAVGASLGDLVQSRYKRLAGVKDSGVRLPGHGGFYDRFDGLLFILPYLIILIIVFQNY
nr:phosphatidate cytidylyltransferase [Saprospiraceae bacterium]